MRKFKSLDFLSPSAQIYFNGEERYNSYFGAFMSVMVVIACLILGIYFFIQTVTRQQISVVYTDEFRGKNSFYNFSNYPLVYNLKNSMGQEFNDQERIIDIVPKIWIRDEDQNWSSKDLKLEKCNFTWYPSYSDELQAKIGGDIKTFCVNPNDKANDGYYTKGTFEGSDYAYQMSFHMFPCRNSTKNNCLPKDEIDRQLGYFYFSLYFVNSYINGEEINPVVEFVDSYSWLTSNNIFKLFNIKFRENKYKSDFGYVFREIKTDVFYTLEPLFIEVSIGHRNQEFSTIRFGNSAFASVYNRKFGKLQDLVAQIGGAFKFIIIVGSILSNYVTDKMFYVEVAENSFCVGQKVDIGENENVFRSFNNKRILNSNNLNNFSSINLNSKDLPISNFSIKNNVSPNNSNNLAILDNNEAQNQQILASSNIKTPNSNIDLIEVKLKLANFSFLKVKLNLSDYIFPISNFTKNLSILNKIRYRYQKLLSQNNIINSVSEIMTIRSILLNNDEMELFELASVPFINENTSLTNKTYSMMEVKENLKNLKLDISAKYQTPHSLKLCEIIIKKL
jgi:hypothetical protein